MNERKIGTRSAVVLFLNLTLAKYLLVVPSFIVTGVGNGAWLVLAAKGVLALCLFALVAALYKPYTALGFGELTRRAFGRYFGGVVNAAAAAMLTVRGAFLFRTLAEAVRGLESENAVIEYLALFILVPAVVCAMKGFNVNVNLSVLILPFTLVSVAAIAAALLPRYDINNIMPVLGEGVQSLAETTLLQLGGMFEVLYLLIFSRYLSGYHELKRGGLVGIACVSLVSIAFTLMYCLCVPYPASADFLFPLYQLTRLIKAGAFFQRMEPIIIFIWAGIVMCSLSTVMLGSCELLCAATGERDKSGFVPIIAVIIFLVGALPDSELEVYDRYRDVLNLSHFFYIILIFAVLILARLRKLAGGEVNEQA